MSPQPAPLPASRRLRRVLFSPGGYVAIFGGAQVGLLWLLRDWFGTAIPLLATAGLVIVSWWVRDRSWRLKSAALVAFIALTTVGPALVSMDTRRHAGITLEQDGMIQIEAAIDRVLEGRAIYGVDWSDTPLALYPALPDGPNPVLRHFVYLPLQVLAGVPVRLLTRALGLPFDYRIVLIAFLAVALLAVRALPISPSGRFMAASSLFGDPLIARFFWAGHNDVCWIAALLWGLVFLGRRRPALAGLAFGTAAAFKPFAVLALPFLLVALWADRTRRSEQVMRDLGWVVGAALAVPLMTVLPFLFADPGAFVRDTLLFASGRVGDAYLISGFGFSALLVGLHVVASRRADFPFFVFQLAAVVPALWIGARRLLRRPTFGRWIAAYAVTLFAFLFFSRFMNDSYVGVSLALAAAIPAFDGHPLVLGPEFAERSYRTWPAAA